MIVSNMFVAGLSIENYFVLIITFLNIVTWIFVTTSEITKGQKFVEIKLT